MPTKLSNLSEIKRAVILNIEGHDAVSIAKQLTADAFAKLYENNVITNPRMLKEINQLNQLRNAVHTQKQMLDDVTFSDQPFTKNHYNAIKKAYVTVDRIRRMMKSQLWLTYKTEFEKRHIEYIAKQEAERYAKENI